MGVRQVNRYASVALTTMIVGSTWGCSRPYRITFQCDERINTFGLPESDPGGRRVDVAIVCLPQREVDSILAERGADDPAASNAWTWEDARRWFDGGWDGEIRRRLGAEEAVETVKLQSGQTLSASVRHSDPFGDRAGILVLADFTGMAEDARHYFTPVIFKKTRWAGHSFTVQVRGTRIDWAD